MSKLRMSGKAVKVPVEPDSSVQDLRPQMLLSLLSYAPHAGNENPGSCDLYKYSESEIYHLPRPAVDGLQPCTGAIVLRPCVRVVRFRII